MNLDLSKVTQNTLRIQFGSIIIPTQQGHKDRVTTNANNAKTGKLNLRSNETNAIYNTKNNNYNKAKTHLKGNIIYHQAVLKIGLF